MADDITEEEDLVLEAQDAGIIFRAEMWVTDTLLGYWPYLLGALAIGLGSIFFWSQYRDYNDDLQRGYAEAVRRVENDLRGDVLELGYQQASGQSLDVEQVRTAADALLALDTSGAGRAEAQLKAAELYRLIGSTDEQRKALQRVVEGGVQPFMHLASASLANLELEAGETDAAISRLESLSTDGSDDFLREQATLDLALVYEHLGRTDEARSIYERFQSTWPESPRLELVRQRLNALTAG